MNELYQFYNENLDIYKLIKYKTGKDFRFLSRLYVINTIIIGGAILSLFFERFRTFNTLIIIVISVISICIVFIILNGKMKIAVEKMCKFKNNKFSWNSMVALNAIRELRVREMEKYFIDNQIYNDEYKRINIEFEHQLEKLKPKLLSIPSYLAVLVTIFTEKFTGKYIDVYNATNFSELIDCMSVIAAVYLVIIGTFLYIYYVVYKGMIFDLRSRKYNKYKKVYDLFILTKAKRKTINDFFE